MVKPVLHDEYVRELTGLFNYLSDGGTEYRKKTAELALTVAKQVVDPYDFWSRARAAEHLFNRLPGLDEERRKDVSKMLSVTVRDLHRKYNRSSEVARYVEEKRKKRKPLAFV